MSLTRRCSQADCLSQILLSQALRQATGWLIFDVRRREQHKTRRLQWFLYPVTR